MTEKKDLIIEGYQPQDGSRGYQPAQTPDSDFKGGYQPTNTGDNPSNNPTPPGEE